MASRVLTHFSHKEASIVRWRYSNASVFCEICGENTSEVLYRCKWCDFYFHLSCAELPQKLEHFYHPCHVQKMVGIRCTACRKQCSGQTYVCCSTSCSFSVHHSCFDLPLKISTPLHANRSLTLTIYPLPRVCNLTRDLVYTCDKSSCSFCFHVGSPVTMSTIKYQGHQHYLLFMESVGKELSGFYMCDFCLHLRCGPLPCTIKDENHLHPLTLTDSPVTNAIECEDKGTDDFYCDVGE
ncbi:unnamed protein product [Dovyalis caffra]|uniref:DC1 domain-containing protein n=1 Tax=Dovyalis caffra TaxID=77055 RepID=A0AAV1RKK1_9ROSI|nr:unnamed protein product [Dovyalis caffra]